LVNNAIFCQKSKFTKKSIQLKNGIIVLFIGTVADAFFVPTLTAISAQLKLNDNVAGVTLVAIGNGAPDAVF